MKNVTLDKSMIRLDEEFVVYFNDESLEGLANEITTLWNIAMNASNEDDSYDGIEAIISMVRRIKGIHIITIEDAEVQCRLKEWRRQMDGDI